MAEPRLILPLVKEETAQLKSFEAFMSRRVELEQQTISGLQALLEGTSPPTERNLMWQCAFEKLLDGTRDELYIRIEELERLKDQMRAVGISIGKAEMYIRDLHFEFEKLESTDSVDSAQAATATAHTNWHDIKSVKVTVQRNLSNFLSSGRLQKEKLQKEKLENEKRLKERDAFEKYHEQDLTYRRMVHQHQQNQKQFLNSIPHRVQEYGAEYWTAVRDVGMMMESFANYLRNLSSSCNSYGSALWASAKNIKPLVDANCHTEAIDLAYSQSPIRFSPKYYHNPGSISPPPSGQTILFGCPLELRTVGELKKIPPVLEYLLDYVPPHWWERSFERYRGESYWRLVNELEQAWTGVEKYDRAFISKLVPRSNVGLLIIAYFMSLPEPVLPYSSLVLNSPNPSATLIWNTWSEDPIRAAVLRAILSCEIRLNHYYFVQDMAVGLGQNMESSAIGGLLSNLAEHPEAWR